jgi:hypothetical protein
MGSGDSDFNVADFFFVSTRLSRLYPNLEESRIIQKFWSPWPHKSYQRSHSLDKSYSKKFAPIFRSLSMVFVFLAKGLLTMPPSLTDRLMDILFVITAGYGLTFLRKMYQISPIIPVAVVISLLVVAHFIVKMLIAKFGISKKDNTPATRGGPRKIIGAVSPSMRPDRIIEEPASGVSESAEPGDVLAEEADNREATMRARRQSAVSGLLISQQLIERQAAPRASGSGTGGAGQRLDAPSEESSGLSEEELRDEFVVDKMYNGRHPVAARLNRVSLFDMDISDGSSSGSDGDTPQLPAKQTVDAVVDPAIEDTSVVAGAVTDITSDEAYDEWLKNLDLDDDSGEDGSSAEEDTRAAASV